MHFLAKLFSKVNFIYVTGLSFVALTNISFAQQTMSEELPITTIVVSIDGFSNEFLDIHRPPFLIKLRDTAAYAPLIPVYPSKTFPNHLSMVTGKYPYEHGIVHNKFYHKEMESVYTLGAGKDNGKWVNARPIWSIAEESGIKTGIYFWPESEVTFDEFTPTYNRSYDGSIPNTQRLDDITSWLNQRESRRPSLVITYFSIVDSAIHEYGLNSNEVSKAIMTVDSLLESFNKKLEENLGRKFNLVIVSDHGAVQIDQSEVVLTESILQPFENERNLKIIRSETQILFYSQDSNLLHKLAAAAKKSAQFKTNRFKVLFPEEMPKHWQYHHNTPALPDLVFEASPSFVFENKRSRYSKATHGYDPKTTSQLDAIFLAKGPSFNNKTITAIHNRFVFDILLDVLELSNPAIKRNKSEDSYNLLLKTNK